MSKTVTRLVVVSRSDLRSAFYVLVYLALTVTTLVLGVTQGMPMVTCTSALWGALLFFNCWIIGKR